MTEGRQQDGPEPGTVGPASSPAPGPVTGAAAADATVSPFGPHRRRLSARRWHRIERIEHERDSGRFYDVTVGFYDDGLVGEIFIDPVQLGGRLTFKAGQEIEGHIDNQAELASRMMQYGHRPAQVALFCTPGTLLRAAIDVAVKFEAEGEAKVPAAPLAQVRALTGQWLGREVE